MADSKVSSLTAASALTGPELFYADDGSNDVKVTATQIKTWAQGGAGLTANTLAQFAATTSAQLAGVISDETGSGALVFATSPTLVTPTLGVASATTINKVTLTAPASGSTLTIANGKTLTASNTLTFTGTDASSVAFGAGGTITYVLRSYIAGCVLSNNGGTPNTKLDVAAGQVADDSNAVMITVAAGTIDCATTGANGLDTGSLANSTWYHVYAIAKTDGTQALLASTSVSSPTQPSGYALKRRIGSFLTDGSAHILAFTQDGDTFYWSSLPTDVQVTNLGTTAVLYTLSVPAGVKTRPIMRVAAPTTNGAIIISSPDETDVQPPAGSSLSNCETSPGWDIAYLTNVVGSVGGIYTNTSSQIRARADAASRHLTIFTRGYVDDRGRYA